MLGYAERICPFIADTSLELDRALAAGRSALAEGAQATLLDIDHGTYPFVTSSNPIAGGACTGLGVGPARVDRVLGVTKAYVTRVGAGPFPSEADAERGAAIRERGAEYGTVTGRDRRCGWLDLVGLRYAARVNGLTGLGEEAYSAAKAGVINFTQNLAVRYGGRGLRANAVCPGPTQTPMLGFLDEDPAAREWLMQQQLNGRFVQPEEVADLAFFLASGAAPSILGTSIVIDGGYIAR